MKDLIKALPDDKRAPPLLAVKESSNGNGIGNSLLSILEPMKVFG